MSQKRYRYYFNPNFTRRYNMIEKTTGFVSLAFDLLDYTKSFHNTSPEPWSIIVDIQGNVEIA